MERMLDCAAEEFGLGKIRTTVRVGGMSSRNYMVDTSSGTYVVKCLIPPFHFADNALEAAYASHVAAAGIPTVTYLRTQEGKLVAQSGDGAAMAMPFVAGDVGQNPVAAALMGEAMARLRRVPTLGLPQKTGWMSAVRHAANIDEVRRDFADDEDMQKLLVLDDGLTAFRRNTLPLLPQSIIHCDAHVENVLFSDGRITALLDWEDATVGPSLYDFCITAVGWCWEGSAYDAQAFAAFAAAYQAAQPLTELERQVLPTCMRHVAVVQTAWRFLQYRVRTPLSNAAQKYRRMWDCGHDRWIPDAF